MQLHYQTLGQAPAQNKIPPLVLLHGLFGSADNWGTVAKHFSQHQQVISVDLRNHGRSPHHDSQTYDDMANDLLALCDTLGLEQINLLGHSLGGKVAMQFATQYPNRINKLIVVDMAIRTYADVQTYLMDAMMAIDLTKVQTRSEVDERLSDSIENVKVRHFLLMNLVKIDGQLQWRINLPALKANYPTIRQAVCESAQFEQPCLFIRGSHSDYVRDDDIEPIKARFTQAKFASLPTGHWVHAEQPHAFIALVAQFINDPISQSD